MNKRTQLLEVIAALPEELVDQALNYVQIGIGRPLRFKAERV
ncbi:MAG: hypothetical protein V7K77_06185 [Nostoc sp.]